MDRIVAIWYVKPDNELGRDLRSGFIQPTKSGLTVTHTHLMDLPVGKKTTLDRIYYYMQGENWSPDGEARPLIQEKGLAHTSMSVGDVIHDKNTDKFYVVARFGFNELNE